MDPLHHHPQDPVDQWDADTLPPPKLRMMCSYGGHIIPRPHDKTLCYMGGETRIVVADRHTSLADLCSRLSTTLLNGRCQFTLKYQLPSEDLDSLVSVTTDEDLDNMVDEYDRLNSSKPSRLRLFLFLAKPETAASMGSLLDDAKSETWFVDALNGAGLLPRGLSDSAAIDNLLEHKDGAAQDNYVESEILQRLRLDSAFVETTSSFGSTSSSPSMSNLPPIKVKMDHMNQMAGLDEQLSQLNVGVPPPPVNNVGGGGGWADDERSEHNVGTRKPPLPLQPVQRKFGHDVYSLPSPDSKYGGAYALHSPDSIASDSSIASANCQPKTNTSTQDPNVQSNATIIDYQIPIQQTTIADSSDTQPQPPSLITQEQQQQQFYQAQQHNQPPQQPVSSSYYPVYAPPPQLNNQQYPLYFLPVTQNNHPYLQPNAQTVSKPDMVTSSMYGIGTGTATPRMIQVPSNQFQQHYMNVSQMSHLPPTPMPGSNAGYEYAAHPGQDPVYYHSVAAPVASQYQTMTPASAMVLTQPAPETAKQ
ncbi:hypothetical protein SSX86_011946 [Deinandra increscens subsp. villosa]|uniref:PB1 domain-containing protein n=1 Tax=Deinandra increscens subsp. villosa TaxID=3103831 RepID=A0AAP0D7T8_9ASTR